MLSLQWRPVVSQQWFSGAVVSAEYPIDESFGDHNDGIVTSQGKLTSPRLFDITVSLHSDPQGDDDGSTQGVDPGSTDQDKFEKIFQFMADAIFESTEGVHKLRKVRIYRNSDRWNVADMKWDVSGRPHAKLNGIRDTGGHMYMYDIFGSSKLLEDPILAGIIGAHEFFHYAHGLRDEYAKQTGDVPVVPSMMGSSWKARSKSSQSFVDLDWLQFSIKNQNPAMPGKFQNTLKTNHHRTYGESCWETLSRSNTLLEKIIAKLSPKRLRPVYAELAAVAPTGNNVPRTDLPGASRSDLDITWETDLLVYEIVLDKSGSMSGTKLIMPRQQPNCLFKLPSSVVMLAL